MLKAAEVDFKMDEKSFAEKSKAPSFLVVLDLGVVGEAVVVNRR